MNILKIGRQKTKKEGKLARNGVEVKRGKWIPLIKL